MIVEGLNRGESKAIYYHLSVPPSRRNFWKWLNPIIFQKFLKLVFWKFDRNPVVPKRITESCKIQQQNMPDLWAWAICREKWKVYVYHWPWPDTTINFRFPNSPYKYQYCTIFILYHFFHEFSMIKTWIHSNSISSHNIDDKTFW